MRLATLLHISDLHLGDLDPLTGDAIEPPFAGKSELLDGLLGHSLASLKRVSRFWGNLRRNEQAALVVTGDLTTVGNPAQYEIAHHFLAELIDLSAIIPHLLPLGMSVTDWKERGIPGNHDHWPGSFSVPKLMFGEPAQDINDNFLKEYPKISEIPLASGQSIKFLMIDSDADVNPLGPNRLFARGHFTSQLDKLEKLLEQSDPENEIRVLCVHHSPAHKAYELGIDDGSRGALNDFIVKQNVAVLLTGHKHSPPLVRPSQVTHLGIDRTYLEARCGSTTQRSTLSYSSTTLLKERPRKPDQLPNALLVHRLFRKSAEIYWHSECYFELPTGYKEKSTFASPKIRAVEISEPFRVFPLTV
jgi:hypothetical protein